MHANLTSNLVIRIWLIISHTSNIACTPTLHPTSWFAYDWSYLIHQTLHARQPYIQPRDSHMIDHISYIKHCMHANITSTLMIRIRLIISHTSNIACMPTSHPTSWFAYDWSYLIHQTLHARQPYIQPRDSHMIDHISYIKHCMQVNLTSNLVISIRLIISHLTYFCTSDFNNFITVVKNILPITLLSLVDCRPGVLSINIRWHTKLYWYFPYLLSFLYLLFCHQH